MGNMCEPCVRFQSFLSFVHGNLYVLCLCALSKVSILVSTPIMIEMQSKCNMISKQICCSLSQCIIRMFIAALATVRHSLTSSLYFSVDVNDDKVKLG